MYNKGRVQLVKNYILITIEIIVSTYQRFDLEEVKSELNI